MSRKWCTGIGFLVVGILAFCPPAAAQFMWDHSCADPEADWHTCCESPGGLKDNNWEIEPVPPPDCPPLPGPNDDVNLNGAVVRLFVDNATIKSIVTGHLRCFKTLNVAESALLDALTLSGNGAMNVNNFMSVAGPVTWQGGDLISGLPDTLLVVTFDAVDMFDTGNKRLLNGVIWQCDGPVTWSGDAGNNLLLFGNSLIINKSSFTINNDRLIQGDGTIRNEAPFTKSESTGVTTIDTGIAFDNTALGNVAVQTGTLRFDGGGTSQGAWSVTQGATLRFQTAGNSTFTFTAPTGISGSGLVFVGGNGITANAGAPVQVTNAFLQGDLHGPGTFFFTNLEWPGGTMELGFTEVQGSLILPSGFGNPVLSNHSLLCTGQMLWGTGTALDLLNNASLRTTGQTSIGGAAKQVEFGDASEWINQGTMNLSTNVLFAGGSGTLGNAEGATMNVGPGLTDATIQSGVALQQLGTLNVHSGQLRVASGSSNGGVFNVTAPGVLLIFQTGTFDVQNAQFNGPGLVRINGGNLRVVGGGRGGTTTVENLEMAQVSARISGTGTLEVTGLLRLLFGAMVDPGLTLSSGTLILQGALLNNFMLDQRTLRNADTGIWNSGRLSLNNGALFHNAAVAILDVRTADDINHTVGAAGTFLNDGYFVKSGGGASFGFLSGVQLVNSDSGILEVQDGEVAIQGGGSNAGLFQIANGSAIIFNSTPGFELNDGSDIQGPGPARLTGGSLIVNALNAIVDNFEMTNGTLTGPGTLTVADSGSWTNGSMTGAGSTAIDSGASFLIDSSVIKAVSQRAIDVAGTLTYRGAGSLRLSDGAMLFITGLFLGDGGPSISSLNNGSVLVDALGNFSVQSPLSITNGVLFVVSGAVNVLSNGRLTLSGGGNFTGGEFHLTDTDPGNELVLSASSYVLDETDVFGPGQMQLGNATMTVAGNTRIDKLLMTSGTVNGSAELIVNQQLDWSSGTMQGPGLTTNAGAARLIGGSTLAGRTFNNNALVVWGNPPGLTPMTSSGGAVFNNFVNFEIIGNDNWQATSGGGTINNFQTFTKTAGTGTSTISPTFNHNGGLLQAQTGTMSFNGPFNQSAGTIVTGPGVLRFNGPGGLNKTGGEIVGGGSIIGSVTNTGGPVKPGASPGTLTINGAYTQGEGGQLEIEIAGLDAGTQYDVLAVTGVATLGGTLRIRPVGGFVPQPGTQFTVLTAGSVSGQFADVTGAGDYSVAYNPTSVVLTVVTSPIPGDIDGDDNVDLADYSTFAVCFGGPGVTTPPAGCSPEDFAASDLDGDGDVDLADFSSFATFFGASN